MNRIKEINEEIARLREEKKQIKTQKKLLELTINYQLKELEKEKANKTEEIRKMRLEINEITKKRNQARPFIRRMNDFLRHLGYRARLSKEKINQIEIIDLKSKEIYGSYEFENPLKKFRFKDKDGKRISYVFEDDLEKFFHDDALIEYNMLDRWLKISKYCETDEFAKKELCIRGDKLIYAKVNDNYKNENDRTRYFEFYEEGNNRGISIVESSKNGTKHFSINPNTMWYCTRHRNLWDGEYDNLKHSAIKFYRNKELINYVIEDFEKAFPGIRRFISNLSSPYRFITWARPSIPTDEITEILNGIVNPDCDFKEESIQKKKV